MIIAVVELYVLCKDWRCFI